MTGTEQKYLTYYFHDSIFTDAHYEYETNTLTLTLQCYREMDSWENRSDEKYTYRLHFEGVRHQILETNTRASWMDMQFLAGEFLDSARKNREEKKTGEALIHYAMKLSYDGWAEILCRNIRVERAVGELAEPESITVSAPKPLSRAEMLMQLSRMENGEGISPRAMFRLDAALKQMDEENAADLPAFVRRVLALEHPICLRTAVRIIGKCGTTEDVSRLCTLLPRTANRPDTRCALLDAIDALNGQEPL